MNTIVLSATDLALVGLLVLALAGVTFLLRLNQHRKLLWSAARAVIQLLLVGMVLTTVFANAHWYWVAGIMTVMTVIAGYEVSARQKRRFSGWWGYGLGFSSMFISSTSVLLFSLLAIIQPAPWYQPQYAIPLLGMLLGNSMTGIALSLDRLTENAWLGRTRIEARLMLGDTPEDSIGEIKREAIRAGLMPIINSMSAAGVVSLPGMMTGQILSGTPPIEAVKYQILILLLITVASGVGSVIAVTMGSRRLFDERARLRLSRLRRPAKGA